MRRFLSIGSIVVGMLLAVLTGALALYGWARLSAGRSPRLGNYAETVEAIPPSADSGFRFAVLGDPEGGLDVYGQLMHKAAAMGATFCIITGDVASNPSDEAFKLFHGEYRSLSSSALPTFACVGNHDMVKGDPSLFRKYLGPEVFSFLYSGSLFIFADNNTAEARERVAPIVRDILSKQDRKPDHVFLVVHQPISDYSKRGHSFERRASSQPIFELIDEGLVDAVLAGHRHGYGRETYKDALLLVTGGAGGHLYEPDDFFHMVVMDVTPSGIQDTLVKLDELPSGLDNIRVALLVHVYPNVIGKRPVLAGILLASALLVIAGWALRRKLPSPDPGDVAPPPSA